MSPLDLITGGGLLAIVIFSIATYVRVDKQIGRVYQRLDEKASELKSETVKKEVCEVVHKNVDTRLERIEEQTECVPKIKAGIDLLLQKNGIK